MPHCKHRHREQLPDSKRIGYFCSGLPQRECKPSEDFGFIECPSNDAEPIK